MSRATGKLNQSQSTISGSLARLREIVGDPLFVRHSRGLTPTAQAEALAEPLSYALSALRTFAAAPVFDPATTQGRITFCATDYVHATLLAPVSTRISADAPNLDWRVTGFRGDGVPDDADQTRAEFLIGTAAMLPETLIARAMSTDRLMLYMNDQHPLTSKASLDLDDLTAFGHVRVQLAGQPGRGPLDDVLMRTGRRRRIVQEITGFLVVPNILRATDLICVAPARLADTFGPGMALRAMPTDMSPVSIYLGWHRRFTNDKRHIWLRQRVLDLSENMR